MPKETFADRLKAILKEKGILQKDLVLLMRSDKGTVSRWVNNKTQPEVNTVKAICKVTKTRYSYLANGKGEMFSKEEPRETNNDDFTTVKIYDTPIVGGHGAENDIELTIGTMAFKTDWLRSQLLADPNNVSLAFVSGDSMSPKINRGDMILVDHSVVDQVAEGIWVVDIGGGPIVKKVQRLSKTKIKLRSENKEYETIIVDFKEDPEAARFIGRVVWHGGRV